MEKSSLSYVLEFVLALKYIFVHQVFIVIQLHSHECNYTTVLVLQETGLTGLEGLVVVSVFIQSW